MVVLSWQKLAADPRYNVIEAFTPPLATVLAQNIICCFGTSPAVLVVSGGIVVSRQTDLHFG